jgi:ectoine hydroxylase-related dioxygenase (phytanoyl-CoA dioxygenase family)
VNPIADFDRDGAVCLRGILPREIIELLQSAIDENLANPSPRAKIASRSDDPGLFVEDFCNWRTFAGYRRFITDSGLGAIAAKMMGSRSVRLYHDHMLTKQAGTRQKTPWHQDQPYYNIEGRQNCSFWIPLDPVDARGAVQFVAGSHKGPWRMPRSFVDAQARWFPEGSLEDLPDIDRERRRHRILRWALQPGDVVCFHMLTVHAAGGSRGRRRVFSVRFTGDDIVHAPRAWPTSPAFPGLEAELPAGAPLDHPLFPRVWPEIDPELLQ